MIGVGNLRIGASRASKNGPADHQFMPTGSARKGMAIMADLSIDRLSKSFKNGTRALGCITFKVADREAVFSAGPLGRRKKNHDLALVAGLEDVSGGSITIRGVT